MGHPYDASYPMPFPVLPVVLRQIDGSAKTSLLPALVDSGADVTIAPRRFSPRLERRKSSAVTCARIGVEGAL